MSKVGVNIAPVSAGLIINNDNQLKKSQDISVGCQLQQVSYFSNTNSNSQPMSVDCCLTNIDTCDDGPHSRNDISISAVVQLVVNPLRDNIEHTASGQQSVRTIAENFNNKLAVDVPQTSSGINHNVANLSSLELGLPVVKMERGLQAFFNDSPIGLTSVGEQANCSSYLSASEEKCLERDAVSVQLRLRDGQALQTNLKNTAIEEICPRTENSFNGKIFELHELMRMAMNGVNFLALIPPGTTTFYRAQVFHLITNKYKVTHNNMNINSFFTELIASSYFTESEVTRLKHAFESRLMSCYLKDSSHNYSSLTNDGVQQMFSDNRYQTPNLQCSKLVEQNLLRHQELGNVSGALTNNALVTLGSKNPNSIANTNTSWSIEKLAHYSVTEYGKDSAHGRSLTSAVVEKQANEIEMVKKAFTIKPHQDSPFGHSPVVCSPIGHSPVGHTPVSCSLAGHSLGQNPAGHSLLNQKAQNPVCHSPLGCTPLGLDSSHSTHLGVSATENDMITNTCSSSAIDNTIELERGLKCNVVGALAQSCKFTQLKLTKTVGSNQSTNTCYKCHICESACSEDTFWMHVLSNHIDKQTAQETQALLYCSHCLEEQDSIGGLRVHESSIHLSKYPCYFCGLSIDSEELNLEHIVAEHCYRHTCVVCKAEFINKTELKQHCAWLNHIPTRLIGCHPELYQCVFCHLKFCKADTVKRHIDHAHDLNKIWYDKEKSCISCSRRFLDDMALNFHLGQDARNPRCAPPINRQNLERFTWQCQAEKDILHAAYHKSLTNQQHAPSHIIMNILSKDKQSRQKVKESSDLRHLTVRNISIKYPFRPFHLLCQLGTISEMHAFTVLDRLLLDVLSMYPDVRSFPLGHNNVLQVNEKLAKSLISYSRSETFRQWLKTVGVDPLPVKLMTSTPSNEKKDNRKYISVVSSVPYSLSYSAPNSLNCQLVSGKHSQTLPQTVHSGKHNQTVTPTAANQQTKRHRNMTTYPKIIPKPSTGDVPAPVSMCLSVPGSTSHLQTRQHLILVPGKGHSNETHQQVRRKDYLATNRNPTSHIQTKVLDKLPIAERKVVCTLDSPHESITLWNTNSTDDNATCSNQSTSAYRLIAPKPNGDSTTAKDSLLQSNEMIDLVNNKNLSELEKSQKMLGVIQTNELQLNNSVATDVKNTKCVEKKAKRKAKPRAATEMENCENERNLRPRKAAMRFTFDDFSYELDEELWNNLSDIDDEDMDDDDEWKPTCHVKSIKADTNKNDEEKFEANKSGKKEKTPESDCTESFISNGGFHSHQKREILKKTSGENAKQKSQLSMYELVKARRGIKRSKSSSANERNVLKRLKFSENNSVIYANIKCCYIKIEKNELVEKLTKMDKYSDNDADMSINSKVKIAREHHCNNNIIESIIDVNREYHCIDNIIECIIDMKSSDNDCIKPCTTGQSKSGRARKVPQKAEAKNIHVIDMPENKELGMVENNGRQSSNMFETTRQGPNLYEKTPENDPDSINKLNSINKLDSISKLTKRTCNELNKNTLNRNDKTETPNANSSEMLLKCNISKTMEEFHNKILILNNERHVVPTADRAKQVPLVQNQQRKQGEHVNTKVNKQQALVPQSTEILCNLTIKPLNVASCTEIAPTLGTTKCHQVPFPFSSRQSTSESHQSGTNINFQTTASPFGSQSPSTTVVPKTQSSSFHLTPYGTPSTSTTASVNNLIGNNVKSPSNVQQAINTVVKNNLPMFSQIPNVSSQDPPNSNHLPRLVQQQSQFIVSQPVGSLMNQSIQSQPMLQTSVQSSQPHLVLKSFPLQNSQPQPLLQTPLQSKPVFQSQFQTIQQPVLQTQFPIQQSHVGNVMLSSQPMFIQQQQQQMFILQQQQQQQAMLIPAAYLARHPFVPAQSSLITSQVIGQQFNSNLVQFSAQIQTTQPYRQTESNSAFSNLQGRRFPLLCHTTVSSQTSMIQPIFTNNFPSCQGQVNSVHLQHGCRPSNPSQSQCVVQSSQITKQKQVQNNKKFQTPTIPQQTSTLQDHSTNVRPTNMSNYMPIFPSLKIKEEKMTLNYSDNVQTSNLTHHPIQPSLNSQQSVVNVTTISSLPAARDDKDKLSGTATSSQLCQPFSQIHPFVTQQQPMVNSVTIIQQKQQPMVNSITTINYPPIFPLGYIKQENPD